MTSVLIDEIYKSQEKILHNNTKKNDYSLYEQDFTSESLYTKILVQHQNLYI